MTPYYADPWLTVYEGDCRTVLASLSAESVHTVVTSPPYWGLRDYGSAGQLGLEPTPEEYVANMVAVFREVRRVLRDDGTVWLNLGDSYYASTATQGRNEGRSSISSLVGHGHDGRSPALDAQTSTTFRRDIPGLKPKDLVGIPWRVAFALQQPYYTGRIPDERDRTWLSALVDGEGTFTILCTTSSSAGSVSYPPIAQVRMTSEGVVAKAASLVGVVSPAQYPPSNRGNRAVYQWRLAGERAAATARELYPYLIEKRRQAMVVWNHQAVREGYATKRGVGMPDEARAKQVLCRDIIRRLNHGEHVDLPSWMVEPPGMTEPGWYLRSDVIWSKPNPMPESVTDRPTKAHEYLFLLSKSPRYYYDADAVREEATMTPQRRLTVSGYGRSSVPGRADNSGAMALRDEPARERTARNLRSVWTVATQPYPGAHFATFPPKLIEPAIKAGCPELGTVLDPFAGSGTTGMVAQSLSRRAVLIDLNGEYLTQAMARNRDIPLGLDVA